MSRIWIRRRRQDRKTRHTFPSALPLSLWLTSLLCAFEWSSQKLHMQHRLAHSQLSDFNCSILIRPQKQHAGDGERKWRGLHPLFGPLQLPGGSQARNPLAHARPAPGRYRCQHLCRGT